jgi:hypothetical protein
MLWVVHGPRVRLAAGGKPNARGGLARSRTQRDDDCRRVRHQIVEGNSIPMAKPPLPRRTTLGPPGPYLLPEAKGRPTLEVTGAKLPEWLHFPLEDGTDLYLPVREDVLRKLFETLRQRFEPIRI